MKQKRYSFIFAITAPLLFIVLTVFSPAEATAQTIPITVENNAKGAPQLFGLPMPQGELYSPDHVRVLNAQGEEIPSQITQVSTWEPADNSIKWIWVFFFSGEGSEYTVEYGKSIRNALDYDRELYVKNNQRSSYGGVKVDTGVLRFSINRGGSGFFDKVELDTEGDGYDRDDVIATGREGRSTFLDLVDDAGIDRSHAVITKTVKELGSGPLHSIVRIEGEYRYDRADNNAAPFITRIHAYAGKSYVRVQHTITYTGNPDKHQEIEGQYAPIATRNGAIKDEKKLEGDDGWTQPDDRIQAAGLSLKYNLSDNVSHTSAYYNGNWWQTDDTEASISEHMLSTDEKATLLQTGPKPNRVPPTPNSTSEERLKENYTASLTIGSEEVFSTERVPGWIDISDDKWGISIGICNFFKEYPKEIAINPIDTTAAAYIWSPNVEPMAFVRKDGQEDSGMIANFAQGLTKTTELVYYFHGNGEESKPAAAVNYFLDPPVAHAEPQWYAGSEVYGKMLASNSEYAGFERGLDYKLQWMLFNQQWEPWYGMWDYGDFKTYYYNDQWFSWDNNEPAIDYMWWLQFMRTGNPQYYQAARATSRHTMDIDNIHWPQDPEYVGATNPSLDYFKSKAPPEGSPYVGMGRRHADQHWTAQLSAHVWNAGWIASYYLDGYHRGLEVAELTGEYYIKRVFGDHGLRGRRLYLSVWNLVEIWDATKKIKYKKELDERVDLMLSLQKDADQAGSLVINRYGYAQVYASNGLRKYYQMTGDEEVRESLVGHALRVRSVPPYNHNMESYLSSISSLTLGYELSKNPSLLEEAKRRAQYLKTEELPQPVSSYENQKALAVALESVSNLPEDEGEFRPGAIWKITNGMRVFGWTHIYNIPYLVYWLDKENMQAVK